MRFAALFVLALAACAPATTYNRGLDISFHPSGRADAQARVVSSAVELKSETDAASIKEAGGVYLGELEVVGKKAGAIYMGSQGGGTLSGRISLEAASRGATHFFLASSNVDNEMEYHPSANGKSGTTIPTSTTRARYLLFRVDRDAWTKLPQAYQPEGTTAERTL